MLKGRKRQSLLGTGLGLFGLLTTIFCSQMAFAETNEHHPLSFVYVHGVNNHGENSQETIYKKFSNLHNSVLSNLEDEPLSTTILDIDSISQIEKDPKVFYWYELSQDSVKSLDTDLVEAGGVRKKKPGLAARVQKNVASMLQDTFWLLNQSNQVRINDSLHDFIQQQVPKDNKFILFGYSGGAIIDVNYLLNYLPYIDLQEVSAQETSTTGQKNAALPPEIKAQLDRPEIRHTCLRALLEKQIARYDSEGNLVFFMDNLNLGSPKDMDSLRNKYLLQMLPELGEANQSLCLPQHKLKGLITFGSPVAALSSRLLKSSQGHLYLALTRYLINDDIFWLNLNRLNDPLGYSIPATGIENLLKEQYALDINSANKGFLYSSVLFQYRVYFYNAHMWYLKHPLIFGNALVDNLKEGYINHLKQ